ncbi:Hypothetical protein CINCED_3A019591 [Cinara cedri]|uniref:Protein kinase domain-containing protein n=1 Tax=Cinara cedri TaxID=506608 RepID=A0A5E4MEF0_9HEMI|nr:Hypothetical protein CINCED_3A019591 [Cinara cedri]
MHVQQSHRQPVQGVRDQHRNDTVTRTSTRWRVTNGLGQGRSTIRTGGGSTHATNTRRIALLTHHKRGASRHQAAKPCADCGLPELRCKTMRLRHIQVSERRGGRTGNTGHARLRGPRSAELRTDRRADRHVVSTHAHPYRNTRGPQIVYTCVYIFFFFSVRRSIGVLMYVLLTGCSPFGGETKQETFCNISQCKLDFPEELFQDISEDAIDLMKKLMVKNPKDRLTANDCLEHKWFHRASVTTCRSPLRVFGCGDEETDCSSSSSSSSNGNNSNGVDQVRTVAASMATSKPTMMDGVDNDGTSADCTAVAKQHQQKQQQQKQQQQQQKQQQQQQHQKLQQQQKKFAAMSKSCDNSPVPAMSASRRKSFKDNMESLVRRLERELADDSRDKPTAAVHPAAAGALSSTCRTLSRANGTQTMPVGGLARGNGRDMVPFTFRRVYVVDEPDLHHQQQQLQHRLRAPSTSSTPNSSSADNSSVSDCSSDTVSEFSIDSSSDRSSIISLEDSLDSHHTSSSSSSPSSWCRPAACASNLLQQQPHRLGKMSASCFNVWDTSGDIGGRRKWPKECSGAVARAMSQFANGCGGGGDCRPSALLKVFDDKTTGDASPCTNSATTRDSKRCVGLELMRERNGNVVVIREIKANGGSSRYARCSELKCESVQSRIRKLQVHHSGGGVQMEKSSNIF